MYDKEIIEKVCNLIYSKDDVCRKVTTIKYDYLYPFKKYYDVNIIVGAINKYLSKEWDDETLASWCCDYLWILCGGFYDDLKEDLNLFEDFLKEVISWSLDGLAFFREDNNFLEDIINDLLSIIEQHKNWDYLWQTRDEWKAVYAPVGQNDEINGDQYVVTINEKRKEYMIIFSEHLKNGYQYQNAYFKYTTRNKFIKIVEKLKNDGYSIISCSEEFYYEDLKDLGY